MPDRSDACLLGASEGQSWKRGCSWGRNFSFRFLPWPTISFSPERSHGSRRSIDQHGVRHRRTRRQARRKDQAVRPAAQVRPKGGFVRCSRDEMTDQPNLPLSLSLQTMGGLRTGRPGGSQDPAHQSYGDRYSVAQEPRSSRCASSCSPTSPPLPNSANPPPSNSPTRPQASATLKFFLRKQ